MRRSLTVMSCCICLVMTFSIGASSAKPRGGKKIDREHRRDTQEVCLCHVPPGNPANAHTICVGEPAAASHLRHGDTLGPCPATCGGESSVTCEDGQFCKRPEGVCDEIAEGVRTERPSECPLILDPVSADATA